jgi:hypothetical protein
VPELPAAAAAPAELLSPVRPEPARAPAGLDVEDADELALGF